MQLLFFVLMGFTSIQYKVLFICLLLVSHNSSAQNIDSLSTISTSESDYQLKIGRYYLENDFLSDALEHCNTGIKLHKNGNDSVMVELVNTIGNVFLYNNQYTKAKYQFKKAVQISTELDNLHLLAQSKGNLGAALEKKGDLDNALLLQKESLEIYQVSNDSIGIFQTLENLGSIYEDKEKYGKAKEYFLNSKQYLKDTLSTQYANVLNNLGDAFRKEGQIDVGIKYSLRALQIAKTINDLDQLKSAFKDLSIGYSKKEDFATAYDYMTKFVDAKEKLLEQNNAIKISSIQARYDFQSKDSEIKLLKAEKNISATRQKLFILIGLMSIAVMGAGFLWQRRKRKTEARLKLYEQEALQIKLAKKEAEENALQNEIKLKKLEKEALQNKLSQKETEETALQNEIRLKTTSLSNYSLHISQKNKMLLDLSESLKKIKDRKGMDSTKTINSLIKEIESHLGEQNEWEEFVNLFNEIHPDFMNKVSNSTNNKLSSSELRLAVLLRLNMSSKEIASILRITPDSVRVARYRLRKKLPISSGEDLVQYFIDL